MRDFAVAIQNAIADENTFRARIPAQLKKTEEKLEDTRADTRAQDAASERLAQVRQRNRQDPHRKAADAALEQARKDWETLTRHIPPA